MRIPVSQIPEDGWTREVEINLGRLVRVIDTYGPQSGSMRAWVTLKNRRGIVNVSGRIEATLALDCHLCLDRGTVSISTPLELSVEPRSLWISGRGDGGHQEVRVSTAELDVSFYDGEELDLTELLEDELLIAAPDSYGAEGDDGCCVRCGRNVEEVLGKVNPVDDLDAHHPFRELAERLATREVEPAQTLVKHPVPPNADALTAGGGTGKRRRKGRTE
jgi:uncharacterized metal-binding protein YceD (DUF177 family)